MKFSTKTLNIILILVFSAQIYAQDSLWTSYIYETESVNIIEEEGDYLWIVKNLDIVKFNRTTGIAEERYPSFGSIASRDIYDFKIDRTGIKWISAVKGPVTAQHSYYIASFDGSKLTIYDSTNSLLFYDDQGMIRIAVDSNNTKWFGTSEGLIKLAGTEWTKYDTSDAISLSQISALAVDRDNNLWVSDYLKHLSKYNHADWTEFQPPVAVISMDFTPEDTLFIGKSGMLSSAGVYKFDGLNWLPVTLPITPSPARRFHASKILAGDDGSLWIIDIGQGRTTYRFYGNQWTTFNDNFAISDIISDSDGEIWAGSTINYDYPSVNGTLGKYNGSDWDRYDIHSVYLPSYVLRDLIVDENNFIWIASDSGLAKTDGVNWEIFNTGNSSLTSNNIDYIAADSTGIVWAVTSENHLLKYENSDWTKLDSSQSGLYGSSIRSISIDRENNKWFSTWDDGVIRFDGTNWIIYDTLNSGIPSNSIHSIEFDKQNNTWIASIKGLTKFDGTNWQVFNKNDGLYDDVVYSIAFDDENNIWCGGYAYISKFNGISWTNYDLTELFPGDHYGYNDVAADNAGIIWSAADGSGLLKFNGSECSSVSGARSISNPNYNRWLKNIAIDKNGKKWCISTHPGYLFIYFGAGSVGTSIEGNAGQVILSDYNLFQNYPNPFNPSTNIRFDIPAPAFVSLKIYDILGREAAVLVGEYKQAGEYEITFNGDSLSSGVYFCKIQAGNYSSIKKMILMK